MTGNYVLDTNIVIAFLADEAPVRERVATAPAIFIPSIVVGELYYGAFKSAWSPRNIERIERFLQHTTLLVSDHITARRYGTIKYHLQQKGRPIPENDIWIAAVTMQYDCTLASRDGHFDEIEGLHVERW